MTVTVRDVCEFWQAHSHSYTKRQDTPRVNKLREVLGDVQMADLRRKQLWDLYSGRGWSYLRDAMEIVKRVFNFAVKPRAGYGEPAPAGILTKQDNPLEGVVVNHPKDSSNWKATECPPEFQRQMTDLSEWAWRQAHPQGGTTADDLINDLASKALAGDPIARDMLRDALRQ
jgi:hypothetical protein